MTAFPRFRHTAFGLILFAGGSLLRAGSAPRTEPAPRLDASVRVFALDRAGIDGSDAAYAVSGLALEAGFCHWTLGLSRRWYDWRNPDAFPGFDDGTEDPWRDLTRLQLGYSHSHSLGEQWSGEVLAGVVSDHEEELDDSLAAYLGGYGVYRARSNLWLLCGLLYSHHPEVDSEFDWVPVLGVAWRPAATRGPSVRLGLPVTRVRWHFSERTRLSLDLDTLEGGVYRLANDNSVQPGGYVEMVGASLILNVETRLRDGLELSAGVGHTLHRELTLYNADGGDARSHDIDHAPSLILSLRKRF